MQKYAVQLSDHDFEPQGDWQSDPEAAILTLQTSAGYDLLVWDPDEETCEIYPQQSLATLTDRLGHTAYARLLGQMAKATTQAGVSVSAALRRQWYLAADLAVLEHPTLLNTAAALLSLTIQATKTLGKRHMRDVVDQARCWLMAAQVTPLKLVASPQPLQQLLHYLLTQSEQATACQMGGRSRAWQLASDAWELSQANVQPTHFQMPSAWTLIRVAALERYGEL